MARLAAILLAFWALCAAPTLCLGGLLEHACGCESEAQCQHEDSCPTDPCSDSVPQKEGLTRIAAALASWVPSAVPVWQKPASPPHHSLRSLPPPGPPNLPRLVFAVSDRPLRI